MENLRIRISPTKITLKQYKLSPKLSKNNRNMAFEHFKRVRFLDYGIFDSLTLL